MYLAGLSFHLRYAVGKGGGGGRVAGVSQGRRVVSGARPQREPPAGHALQGGGVQKAGGAAGVQGG